MRVADEVRSRLGGGLRRAGGWARALLDFCYPGVCRACGEAGNGDFPLCDACLAALDALEATPACARCAMPLGYEGAPCRQCRGAGAALFERVVRLGPFHEPLRELIHAVKYKRAWGLGEQLADRLLEVEGAKSLLCQADVIVPVPLHRLRQMSRGFNQAEVVGARIAKRCGIGVARAVVRVRNTEPQTTLHSAHRREANLSEAFALTKPAAVAGKNVVLIDDVWTTGATMRAVARALAPAGPASVSALVLAAADPRGVEGDAKFRWRGEV